MPRPVAFGHDPTVRIGQRDPDCTAVFKPQRQLRANQVRHVPGRVQFDGSLDSMQTWDGHPRPLEHSLVATDPVADTPQRLALFEQLTNARALFDELQRSALHDPDRLYPTLVR